MRPKATGFERYAAASVAFRAIETPTLVDLYRALNETSQAGSEILAVLDGVQARAAAALAQMARRMVAVGEVLDLPAPQYLDPRVVANVLEAFDTLDRLVEVRHRRRVAVDP